MGNYQNLFLKKYGRLWTGFNWLRKGASGFLLRKRFCSFNMADYGLDSTGSEKGLVAFSCESVSAVLIWDFHSVVDD
jgi:hypothetical protein